MYSPLSIGVWVSVWPMMGSQLALERAHIITHIHRQLRLMSILALEPSQTHALWHNGTLCLPGKLASPDLTGQITTFMHFSKPVFK